MLEIPPFAKSIGPPDERVVGYQRWRDILLLHWSAPESALRGQVPPALELELFAGRAWLSILTFRVERARVRGLPPRAGFDFLELNLRTYVRRGETRGIFFLRIDASSMLAIAGARLGVGLPYHRASQAIWSPDRGHGGRFRSRAGARRFDASFEVGPSLGEAAPDTRDDFLVERYALFAPRGPWIQEMRVSHRPYSLDRVLVTSCEQTLTRSLGVDRPPELAHYCAELEVALRGPWLHPAHVSPLTGDWSRELAR